MPENTLKKRGPGEEVDPRALPLGARVGAWRVVGFVGRGAYGTLYRVEREGREPEGSAALKLAAYPGDERFAREAWLLKHVHSAYVPRLYEEGAWEHASGKYPYLVLELMEGEPLYEWAGRRNPTERQVLRLLAQVAHAIADTHEAGALHRDVKGSNVLVRWADERAFLTDFGAGDHRGAATLTTQLLPPGTTAYRSPEAWAFLKLFRRHPTALYPASACDDLFSLAVMAYRVLTDEYPPPTRPEEAGSEVWREGGVGPQPPSALNKRVSPGTDAVVMRLLSVVPEERFGGRAREAAQALERAAERAGPPADLPLFEWVTEHRPRWRSPGGARLAEQRDAAAREEWARREAGKRVRAQAGPEQARSSNRVRVWGAELAVALVGLLLAGLAVVWLHRGQEGAQATSKSGGGSVAVGDNVSAAAAALAPVITDVPSPAVGLPMPEKPFPGQRTPPCNRNGEVELRGGCWYALRDATLPCREAAYDWEKACYLPSFPGRRQPTSQPP